MAPILNENKKTVNVVPILEPNNIDKADLSFIKSELKKAIVNIVTAFDDERRIVKDIPRRNAM